MEIVEVVVLSSECYHCEADCRGGGDIDGKVLVSLTAELGVGRCWFFVALSITCTICM